MGSKKLKAIVVKATRKKLDNIADLDALKVAAKNAMDVLKANPVTGSGLRQLGTAVLVNIVNNIGAFPTKNWQESYYDKGDDISGETLAEKYLVKPGACHRCPIACGRVVNVNGKVVGGPEYEPLWAYGGNCGNNDLNVIDECNMLCNEYGLDAISVPCTIAAAMELYQRGYIKEEECAGVPLEWGSTRALVEWTKRMGNPETELDWLMSSGSARLCEHYGHPEYSMSVKKQEMPAYDARAIQGIGITYATSNRGGCHVRGYMISSRSSGSAPAAGSYRYQRKGSFGQDLPGSDSCHRLHGALSVYLLRHGRQGVHRPAERRHRHQLDHRTGSGDWRPYLQHRENVQQGCRYEA